MYKATIKIINLTFQFMVIFITVIHLVVIRVYNCIYTFLKQFYVKIKFYSNVITKKPNYLSVLIFSMLNQVIEII